MVIYVGKLFVITKDLMNLKFLNNFENIFLIETF